jgi:hypothetical protein
MRANNDGEGGIMALITLIRRKGVTGGRRTKLLLAGLGVFGASLFFGDSMITPAISVLSAIEGVKALEPLVECPPPAIPPRLLLGLWLYATSEDVRSARHLARLCERAIGVTGLCMDVRDVSLPITMLPEAVVYIDPPYGVSAL